MNKKNLFMGVGIAALVGTILIVYFALLYWIIGTLLVMVYPMATTAQKIALTILLSFIFGAVKTNVTYKK